MCWRKDVQWNIHTSDDPKEFMSVTSGEYVLAVPDYSHEARYMAEATAEDLETTSMSSDQKNAAHFKKVIMKLSGDVKWAAGLVFERNVNENERSTEFRPHYDVILRNPNYINPSEREVRMPNCKSQCTNWCRITMLIAVSGVITFIFLSQSLLPIARIGMRTLNNQLQATILFI
jgi:hypothetical protein